MSYAKSFVVVLLIFSRLPQSATHGQYDVRPTVTFPAAGRHRPLVGTDLYCLVTEIGVCIQLA